MTFEHQEQTRRSLGAGAGVTGATVVEEAAGTAEDTGAEAVAAA